MTVNIQQRVMPRHSAPSVWQRGSSTPQTVAIISGISTLLFLTLLGFFYLTQVLGTASRNRDIHALETTIVDLKEKQRALELQSAELRSIQMIENNVQKLNLVATDQVAYLAADTHQVALSHAR